MRSQIQVVTRHCVQRQSATHVTSRVPHARHRTFSLAQTSHAVISVTDAPIWPREEVIDAREVLPGQRIRFLA
jgi:hypothetical protein